VLIRGVESDVNSSGTCGRAEAEPGPTTEPEGAVGGERGGDTNRSPGRANHWRGLVWSRLVCCLYRVLYSNHWWSILLQLHRRLNHAQNRNSNHISHISSSIIPCLRWRKEQHILMIACTLIRVKGSKRKINSSKLTSPDI
jgi:hypothetical protein